MGSQILGVGSFRLCLRCWGEMDKGQHRNTTNVTAPNSTVVAEGRGNVLVLYGLLL